MCGYVSTIFGLCFSWSYESVVVTNLRLAFFASLSLRAQHTRRLEELFWRRASRGGQPRFEIDQAFSKLCDRYDVCPAKSTKEWMPI